MWEGSKPEIYARSDLNFKLVKERFDSIVTLLVANPFGKDVTQMIAKTAYLGWMKKNIKI